MKPSLLASSNELLNEVKTQKLICMLSTLSESIKELSSSLKISKESRSTQTSSSLQSKSSDSSNKQQDLSPKELIIDLQTSMESQCSPQSFNIFDPRHINLKIPVPMLTKRHASQNKKRQQEIREGLGLACKKIFTISFGLLRNEKLDYKQVKIFTSEKLLYWILKLIKKNQLDEKQISIVNQALQHSILPYNKQKFPQSQEKGQNLTLNNIIIERKNMQQNQGDMIQKTNSDFTYKQSGNYNSEIMIFINKIVSIMHQTHNCSHFKRLYQQPKRQSLYTMYQKDIGSIFSKIYDPSFLVEMDKYDPRKKLSEQCIYNSPIAAQLAKRGKKKSLMLKRSESLAQYQGFKDQNETEIEREEERKKRHKAKVKLYTEYQISKKLSENFKQFSDHEIAKGNLDLNDPSLFRIVTKWCQQLNKYFIKGNISQRQQPFRIKDTHLQKFLDKKWMIILQKLLHHQKKPIDEYINSIKSHRNKYQHKFGNQPLHKSLAQYSYQQGIVGQFCAVMFKNFQDYLIGYLNILMHQINCALKKYQKIFKYRQQLKEIIEDFGQESSIDELIHQSNYYNHQKNIDLDKMIPELISFRVGDLFRSRLSSNQMQIISVYKQLQKINFQHPQILKIVRVKNKLKEGTRDILINLLYRETIIVEIQLAVNRQNTKFLAHSKKFSHYLYELIRNTFGPIHEMCNNWASHDPRYKFYEQNFEQQNVRIKNAQKSQNSCKHKKTEIQLLPFECSKCKYYYTGFTKYEGHEICSNKRCNARICALCNMQMEDNIKSFYEQLNDQNMHSQPYKLLFHNKCDQNFTLDDLSEAGHLIKLKQASKKIKFNLVKKKNQYLLLGQQDQNKYYTIACFDSNWAKAKKKLRNLLKEYAIVTDKTTKCNHEKIITNYFVPQQIRQLMKAQKKSLMVTGQKIQHHMLQRFSHMKLSFIKQVNLSDNRFDDFGKIAIFLPQVEILVLNSNLITKISNEILLLRKLNRLELNKNPIQSICIDNVKPSDKIGLKFISLQENTQLKEISNSFYMICPELQTFNISFTKIQEIYSKFGGLKKLQKIIIKSNSSLKKIADLSQIECIKRLEIIDCARLQFLPDCLRVQNIKLEKLPNMDFHGSQSIKLRNFKQLTFSGNDSLKDLPALQADQGLQKIQIINNKSLENLPKQMSGIKNLRNLKIQGNDALQHLPQELPILSKLNSLIIDNNCMLKNLPSLMQNLHSLKYLKIKKNDSLAAFPKSFAGLKSLQQFIIQQNEILTILPQLSKNNALQKLEIRANPSIQEIRETVIDNLPSLKYLTIDNNQNLKRLPEKIQNNPSLKELKISKNHKLTEIFQIKNAKNFQKFTIIQNHSVKLIRNIEDLKYLRLYKNKSLVSLPFLNKNMRLRKLDIISNQSLASLPDSINLQNLLELKIECNKSLKALPQALKLAKSLTNLTIYHNQLLKQLPCSKDSFQCLLYLRISGQKSLRQIPESIGGLFQLKQLIIDDNDSLKILPKSLSKLSSLEKLVIYENENLESIPQLYETKYLQNIQIQFNNSLKSIPHSIGSLPQLRQLIILGNQSLKNLPQFSPQSPLQKLIIKKNHSLQFIYSSIGNLKSLKQLSIWKNLKLKNIAESLGNLTQLDDLTISSNKNLAQLPMSVVNLYKNKVIPKMKIKPKRLVSDN